MNLSNRSSNEILFVNFNQDNRCLSVGTKTGFQIHNCEPFEKFYGREGGGASICEMLFCTSLVALAGSGDQPNLSPRRLNLFNTKRESTICELNFSSSILAVRLNRKRLVVVLEEQIHIFDISTMKGLHVIDTLPNPRGLASLSPTAETPYLVYPTNTASGGKVNIFDAENLQDVTVVTGHKTPVSALTLSYDGKKVATASEKGTVIRVFSVPDATLLHQYRRGSYSANIFSLSFNLDASLLAVSSDSDTVHIFKLDHQSNMARRASVTSLLPGMISDIWEPARDFAFLKLPSSGVQSVCGFSSTTPQIMVATSEGYFYQYSVSLESGGECFLLKRFSLLDQKEAS